MNFDVLLALVADLGRLNIFLDFAIALKDGIKNNLG
jgi:hypothetical protein